MKDNVNSVVRRGLCCSCGICIGICPRNCIEMIICKGVAKPNINNEQCINCGLCFEICPGKDAETQPSIKKSNYLVGNVRKVYIGYIKNEILLKNTTSGGICTSLISKLLSNGIYDTAFLIDTFNYSEIVKSKPYTKDSLDTKVIGGSRYIPISHEEASKYICKNRKKRIIIVGTSCAIHGFRNLISRFNLEDRNYLLIGLFCDKTMNYNVWRYFNNKESSIYGKLEDLYFRSKDECGWPGNMKLQFEKKTLFLDKEARLAVKDIFCNRRCLYCTDKLNIDADISLGDNYTGLYVNNMGSSNIVIRTKYAETAFDTIKEDCVLQTVDIKYVAKSQGIEKKIENQYFLNLHLRSGKIKIKILVKYLFKLLKIYIGENYPRHMWLMRIVLSFQKMIKGY